ncbi:NAD(P)/FAD-dependent oxidoreductase [Qaidamihabitans albus]|uniref:NAD(P)/FAD-dependent oxidoreductase n=1 Tax=Qaidamihabitans albus TaxID=2795733 RepID=UPI0018F15BCC|nr:FAD-dependent oxidoreductase [Qaidamihabitans albus]
MTAEWPAVPRTVNGTRPGSVVVVGGGTAAHRCVFELRRKGFHGKVTLISSEPYPPYDRTLVSKDMLADHTANTVVLSERSEYDYWDIDLRLELTAEWLDVENHCLGLSDGSTQPYERLVLCVGGRPAVPPALDAPGVIVLRDAEHSARLRKAMVAGRHLVVIGGGFIGGEVATAAIGRGLQVTLVEAASQILEPVLGDRVGAQVAQLHRDHGVNVLTGTPANAVTKTKDGFEVALDGGAVTGADIVVLGVGMVPNTEWLRGSGLHLGQGVLTDENCQSSAGGIFAAGDCARWWHPTYAELCRVEHWDTAGRHGATVASAVLGEPRSFAPLPFFWSDQHDVRFQWAGHAPSWDEVRVEGDRPDRFAARYFRSGKLAGLFVAGQPRVFARARRELVETASRRR